MYTVSLNFEFIIIYFNFLAVCYNYDTMLIEVQMSGLPFLVFLQIACSTYIYILHIFQIVLYLKIWTLLTFSHLAFLTSKNIYFWRHLHFWNSRYYSCVLNRHISSSSKAKILMSCICIKLILLLKWFFRWISWLVKFKAIRLITQL